MSTRPEHVKPPDLYYDDAEATKYANSSHYIKVQTRLSERALELLVLPKKRCCHILDLGCGSGLSGAVLSDAGHLWTGVDISKSMLGVAVQRDAEGDLIEMDMGDGLPFRPGQFDGCISISAVQWLCSEFSRTKDAVRRLRTFFTSLYTCLAPGSRSVFQLYPENANQLNLITQSSLAAGFSTRVLVDFPNSTKAKKIYLLLVAGASMGGNSNLDPEALPDMDSVLKGKVRMETGRDGVGSEDDEGDSDGDDEGDDAKMEEGEDEDEAEAGGDGNGEGGEERRTALFSLPDRKNRPRRTRGERVGVKSREWIVRKKDRQERQGKRVPHPSRYTGRRRKPQF